MEGISLAIIVISFFIFVLAVTSQMNRIKNLEVKKFLGKISDAHLVSSGVFDEPPFALMGVIFASLYTFLQIFKLTMQGKLYSLIKLISKEKEFLRMFSLISFFWIVGTVLAIYKLYLQYALLVLVALLTVVIKMLIGRFRELIK